ncbi:MAG: glycosyltransferase [Deltaproteobacteria bacterium]|nr:glycosyltransferase [Deltaproteobacteria bacterium]
MPTPNPGIEETSEQATQPLRVALVHDWLTGMRGGEKVLETLGGLFPQAPIFTLFHFQGSVSKTLEAHPIHTSFLQNAPFLRRYYRRYLPVFPIAVEDLNLAGFDLIVSTSHCVAKGILPPPGARHVCYCHTPMRYAWDQERAYFPNRKGWLARFRGAILSALRTWDAASASRVDVFVANSRFVAERVKRYYGRSAWVVPPPVEVDFYTPLEESDSSEEVISPGSERERAPQESTASSRDGGDSTAVDKEDGYLLVVSALAPYKRLEVAIRACERRGLPLRIVGTGPEEKRLRREAGPQTQFLGRVSAERLRELYRGALFLLQPGVEDFGIAPVEALACGTPVIAAGRGGVLDIVEDGVHGVLYGGSLEEAELLEAIDKASQIRFNNLDLRHKAEQFSSASFLLRMKRVLSEDRPDQHESQEPKL